MKKPKILLMDIETLPIVFQHIAHLPEYNSDRWGLTMKAEVNSVLCFGYKWLGEDKTNVIKAWDYESGKKNINDDRELLKAIVNIISQADAIVTHFGTGFDFPFIQTRLLLNNLTPLPPAIAHIDTKKISSRNLFFMRNRLDYLAEKLNTTRKLENGGWKLWQRLSFSSFSGPCAPTKQQIKEDKDLMVRYNARDVKALEKLFLVLRPFINNIPNHNLFNESLFVCHNCGSSKTQARGFQYTKQKKYRRYHCQNCGSWGKIEEKKGKKK